MPIGKAFPENPRSLELGSVKRRTAEEIIVDKRRIRDALVLPKYARLVKRRKHRGVRRITLNYPESYYSCME